MNFAQERNRNINRQIERTDMLFRLFFGVTTLMLVVLATLTFTQILKVNEGLQAQIKNNRAYTEQTIQSIKDEDERFHREYTTFLKCVLLIPRDKRDSAAIDACVVKSESAGNEILSTDNTAGTSSNTVTNPTTAPKSTAPPKQPETPQPTQPVPTAPPPNSAASYITDELKLAISGIVRVVKGE